MTHIQQYIIGFMAGLLFILSGCSSSNSTPITITKEPAPTTVSQTDTEILFVTGTPPDFPLYQYTELVYSEAFRRLGIAFRQEQFPFDRNSEMVSQGLADGEVYRIYEFLDSGNYPNHIRVEEPLFQNTIHAFVTSDKIVIDGWESVIGSDYRIGYRRGIKKTENSLLAVTNPDLIIAVESPEQGFDMLLSERIDIYTNTSLPEEWQESGIRKAGIFEQTPLYPYMHKKHADLAIALAELLREMKAEGLLSQYSQQVGLDTGLE